MTGAPLRIAIADDHALFRQGLRSMLTFEDGVSVVAEIDRASELDRLVERESFDLLLLDLQMERSCLGDVQRLSSRVAIVVVTASEQADDALAALLAGAGAVVFKRFAIDTLMAAITAVRDGHVWMPPVLQSQITDQLRTRANQKLRQSTTATELTVREREIVQHVARGMRNAEVAARLSISEVTVKTHLNNVFQKLGIRDRVALTLFAVRTGLIAPQDGRS